MNKKTNEAKILKSIRLSPLAIQVLAIERGELSEAEYFEELMIANVRHVQSRKLIADYLKNDSRIQSMLTGTLRETVKAANTPPHKARCA